MCGIFGIYNLIKQPISKVNVKKSTLLMKHRGPDAFEQWGITDLIELAHVRLSIIDVSVQSNQPFESQCGNYIIVFNGEIYNYLELKEELIKENVQFRTNSDTEVLLNAFVIWGDSCVLKFNGDWAFAIYDKSKNRIFCSRDRFGIKPFNYTIHNGSFIFSSEIKSIICYSPDLKIPNYNVINNYCRNSLGAQHNETWFQSIYRLKPAHNLIIENGNVKLERYWNYPSSVSSNLKFEEAKKDYLSLFKSAVKLRMRSDVPLGATLSAGVDSGSIVSVLSEYKISNHKTYTACFNAKSFAVLEKKVYSSGIEINESKLVQQLVDELDLEANFVNCDNLDLIEELKGIVFHLEAGHSSPAVLPLTKVMDRASKDVKVVLEGQGADELLSGYVVNTFPYLILDLFKKFKFTQIKRELNAFRKFYSLKFTLLQFLRLLNTSILERIYHRYLGIHQVFKGQLKHYQRISDYPKYDIEFNEKLNEVLYRSHIGGLVNLLHYGDAISMSKSIESRLPFLDHRLVEFVFKLPFQFKMKDGIGKVIHREALKEIVPAFILRNPLKFGFNTPLSDSFKSFETKPVKLLLSEECVKRGIFDQIYINKILDKHIAKEGDYSTFLYRLLSVEIWFRTFIDNNKKCV